MYNFYGPTETTIQVCFYKSTKDHHQNNTTSVPIGKPIFNTKLYVLDQHRIPVKEGQVGELYVSGLSVGRGYLNNTKLTKACFLDNPFDDSPDHASLYKTGDLVRVLSKGDLLYIGRTDSQIKISGIRVDPIEVESVLNKHPHILNSALIATTEQSHSKLTIYYQSKIPLAFSEIKTYLQKWLPEYLLPTQVVRLNEFPRAASGKIDRKKLSQGNTIKSRREVTTQKPTQLDYYISTLSIIWEDVLNTPPASFSNDFFDIGGDSLRSIQLLTAINNKFNASYTLPWVFKNTTIFSQANKLRSDRNTSEKIPPFLCFNPQGKKKLFLIHSGQNGAHIYMRLGQHLPPDLCIYAIDSYNLYHAPPIKSMKDLASHYLQIIETIEPEGPYFLGGWSFGGNVAYEIVQLLKRKNKPIGDLFLFDTHNLSASMIETIKPLALEIYQHQLNSEIPKQYEGYKHALLKHAEISFEIMANYSPEPYEGKMILFKAMKPSISPKPLKQYDAIINSPLDQPYNNWDTLSRDLTIHKIYQAHDSILTDPVSIRETVDIINKAMKCHYE